MYEILKIYFLLVIKYLLFYFKYSLIKTKIIKEKIILFLINKTQSL